MGRFHIEQAKSYLVVVPSPKPGIYRFDSSKNQKKKKIHSCSFSQNWFQNNAMANT